MNQLSDDGAIDGWDRGNPARRCTAHKKTGQRCRRWAIRGGTVCTHHGGNTPAVKAKARRRLEDAADQLAKQLLGIAESAQSEQVRLAAVKDALDRAGLKAPTQVEVEVGPKPWEGLVEAVAPMTRAESRARRGIPDTTPPWNPPAQLEANRELEIVDAEVVEPSTHANGDMPQHDRGNGHPQATQPGSRLMTVEEANAALLQAQRQYNTNR